MKETTLDGYLAEQLKDPEFKKEYEKAKIEIEEEMKNHEDLASGYGIILVKRDGKVRPIYNTTKQECYDVLFKILKEKEDDAWKEALNDK